MKPLRIASAAESDVSDAVLFYEEQLSGLGVDFLEEVSRTIDSIREFPAAFGRQKKDIRMKLVHRFPYAVYYRDSIDEILILAVSHTARLPRY